MTENAQDARLKPRPAHKVGQIRTPLHIILECTCGWRHRIKRRQNATARTSQIIGAVNRHLDAQEEDHG